MGQAKLRGSKEERTAAATARADVFKPHSANYRRMFVTALKEAEHLGLSHLPELGGFTALSDDELKTVRKLCNTEYLARLRTIVPGYWGASCQTLATHLFALLRADGYKADLVVGEVVIQGNFEYEATIENIREEYLARATEGSQRLHMWVTLGDDIIVDAGLADRLIKYYRVPERVLDPVLVCRADEFGMRLAAHHSPMLVGADFATKTNSVDPFWLAEHYRPAEG